MLPVLWTQSPDCDSKPQLSIQDTWFEEQLTFCLELISLADKDPQTTTKLRHQARSHVDEGRRLFLVPARQGPPCTPLIPLSGANRFRTGEPAVRPPRTGETRPSFQPSRTYLRKPSGDCN